MSTYIKGALHIFFFPFFYLLLVDVQDSLQRQLFKVQFVTLIKVCAHGLRVAIHHHSLLAKLTQRADTGDGTPIKFHTAACRDSEIGKRGRRRLKLQHKEQQKYYIASQFKLRKLMPFPLFFFLATFHLFAPSFPLFQFNFLKLQNINFRSIMCTILIAGKTVTS